MWIRTGYKADTRNRSENLYLHITIGVTMSGKPFQSSLIPYRDEIFALRRNKPPVSYARIAEILHEKYGVTVQRAGINKFVRVRAKRYKPCKYAWNVEPESAKKTAI